MTDLTPDQERGERIRRLQQRRSSAKGAVATSGARRSRRHPAAATRWLLAGASVASFFTIAGSVAVASRAGLAGTQPATPTTTITAPTGGDQPASATPTPKTTPQPTDQPAPTTVPHTTTRGS